MWIAATVILLIYVIYLHLRLDKIKRIVIEKVSNSKQNLHDKIESLGWDFEELEGDINNLWEHPELKKIENYNKEMVKLYKEDPTFGLTGQDIIDGRDNLDAYRQVSGFPKSHEMFDMIEKLKNSIEEMKEEIERI